MKLEEEVISRLVMMQQNDWTTAPYTMRVHAMEKSMAEIVLVTCIRRCIRV